MIFIWGTIFDRNVYLINPATLITVTKMDLDYYCVNCLFQRLHRELKDGVEKQLEALPFGTEMGNGIYTDDETVRNLQEQLQLANQVSGIYIF